MPDEIRPSSLPKLAACRCFASNPVAGPAAQRGTRLDAAIRSIWQQFDTITNGGINATQAMYEAAARIALPDAPADDIEAVVWALSRLVYHCGPFHYDTIETREECLKAAVPLAGIATGTMDAAAMPLCTLFDFKSGEIRNYKEQMAAYSLACMHARGENGWKTILLFIDKQVEVVHTFTREEAETLVRSIRDAEEKPTTCEYCSWCSKFTECPAVDLDVQTAMNTGTKEGPMMERLLDDHQQAADFLTKFKTAEEFSKRLKASITERLATTPSAYFSVSAVAGRRQVSPAELAERIGAEEVVKLCSLISLKDAEAAWNTAREGEPFPEEIIKTAGGHTSLRVKPQKKA
jgi:hypothetical protein